MKIPIKQIHLGPRQRLDAGDLTELKDSLAARGQIHSIGVRPFGPEPDKYQLIWGRRRFQAACSLSWTEIEATVRDNLSEIDEQLIEFEEDFVRKDRTWQENCLSFHKLNQIMEQRWKRGEIETWSQKQLGKLTGYPTMTAHYYLTVGEALAKSPRDEEIWSSTGWTTASKVLLERNLKEIDAEVARRRPAPIDATALGAEVTPAVVPADGQVQELYPTPEKITMWVEGRPYAYDEEKPENLAKVSSLVLAYGFRPSMLPVLQADLRPGGYAVIWDGDVNSGPFVSMPRNLVWNLINTPAKDLWPFAGNAIYGQVLRKGEPTQEFEGPSGCVISAIQDDDPTTLPPSVVDFCISTLTTERMAVVLPCGVNPVYVAELGRIPLWYEPDPAKFQAKFDALKAFYEQQIPGVEVKLRPV